MIQDIDAKLLGTMATALIGLLTWVGLRRRRLSDVEQVEADAELKRAEARLREAEADGIALRTAREAIAELREHNVRIIAMERQLAEQALKLVECEEERALLLPLPREVQRLKARVKELENGKAAP